ncbi:hypothetical protein JCM8547_002930 [Rhodosporidiobolus lusitaniae]
MAHFTPPPSSPSSSQTLPAAELPDPASPAFAASLLDPRSSSSAFGTAQGRRGGGSSDSPSSLPSSPASLPFSASFPPPPGVGPVPPSAAGGRRPGGNQRPSLPELQKRTPFRYGSSSFSAGSGGEARSPTLISSGELKFEPSGVGGRVVPPTLSRHASEGAMFRPERTVSPSPTASSATAFPPSRSVQPPARPSTVPPVGVGERGGEQEEEERGRGMRREGNGVLPPGAVSGGGGRGTLREQLSARPIRQPGGTSKPEQVAAQPLPAAALAGFPIPRVASPLPLHLHIPPYAPPPTVLPPVPSSSAAAAQKASHLPPLQISPSEGGAATQGPTSYQNWDVATEMEFTLAKVVSEGAVDELIKDENALRHFRQFIASHSPSSTSPLLLDLYVDLSLFSILATSLRLSSSAILSTYLTKTSPSRLVLPLSLRAPVVEVLSSSSSLGLGLVGPLKELLSRLYEREYQPFLQKRLVEMVVGRLGSWKAGYGWTGGAQGGGRAPNMVSDGLADCYCLTNPRLRDNPIVLASEGFSQLTGYPLDAIVGRNCRFLQGPGTAPESTLRLREALNAGEGITSLILNYRLDGTPFYNLLCMLPLKDASGTVKYFLGGQIDVTGSIASLSSLAGPSPAAALAAAPGDSSSLLHQHQQQSQANGEPAIGGAGAAHFTPLVQAQTDRLYAAQSQVGGAMDVKGVSEVARSLPFSEQTLVSGGGGGTMGYKSDGRGGGGKGKEKEEQNGGRDEEEDGAASEGTHSTLSVHRLDFSSSSPISPSHPQQHHHSASSTSSAAPEPAEPESSSATAAAAVENGDSQPQSPSSSRRPRSRTGSFTAAAGIGVRAAAEAIASLAVGGARKVRRVASRDSGMGEFEGGRGGKREQGRDGDGGGGWEGDGEGEKREEREREKRKRVGPLMGKLREFEATYSRVALLRKSSREVLFCTPELLSHCGLPPSAQSTLISLDFTKMLGAPLPSSPTAFADGNNPNGEGPGASGFDSTPEEENGPPAPPHPLAPGSEEDKTRRVRRNVRLAIEGGSSWTGLVGLRPEGKGRFFGKSKYGDVETKNCVLHLTPLCEKDGNCEAFVAVFG